MCIPIEIIAELVEVARLQRPLEPFCGHLLKVLGALNASDASEELDCVAYKMIGYLIDIIDVIENTDAFLYSIVRSDPAHAATGKSGATSDRGQRQHLTAQTKHTLMTWLQAHAEKPYPTAAEKEQLCMQLRIPMKQLEGWFLNARRRYLPRKASQFINQEPPGSGQLELSSSPSNSSP
jgi:hypothetical protein